MPREKVIMGWSGGKDSALALREILRGNDYEVVALVTTCTEGFRRISMHGVRCSLLKAQTDSLGIACKKVFVSRACTNAEYEARMKETFLEFKNSGVTKVVFGDLFLEEIREYRDRMLKEIGMTALYPIWGRNTAELAREFIRDGFRAVLVCTDARAANFSGRQFDSPLLNELPANVDPCGENGEFHTFVYDGPIFRKPVGHRTGPIVTRDNFTYADLRPDTAIPKPKHKK
jgi:uncharacterized protein (TIGR00290 family)